MNSKRKIIFFLPPVVGGAERVSITISKFLGSEGYEVVYVILGKNIGDIRHFIPSDKRIIHIKIINIWDFTITKIIHLLQKEKPEFTFSSNRYINVRVLIASHIVGGIKSIVRNDNGLKTLRWDNKILMRISYPWASKIIAQQDEMRDEIISYTKIASNRVLTIPNPIDIAYIDECIKAESPYSSQDDNQYKYVWVARFSYEKGHDLLLKAFCEVRKTINNAHLYLIGKYDESQSFYHDLKQYVEIKGMKDCVHFIGFDKNPYRWVKYADCYVMPSRWEGLPNSLVEAMYIGKPVVATKCVPVVSRIVEDGYNGILAEKENIQSLVKSMIAATELRDFNMTYHPSTKHDFVELLKIL